MTQSFQTRSFMVKPGKYSRQSLADEIYAMRLALEQFSLKERSLSSEAVVELSGKLDRKINEYMKLG
ncbi:Spo0E family sporulation regulatory protein-aspartic acid phosphatase [Paenibacillus turpanensis]|uniref:Spo0E family sporulation regulatory protein-aspartic acid phosphatase n=1 Tax=Paenibacillus turpanensis TaxID=2689078 RepID=UPI00140D0104